jgi:hypothetical protein
VSEIIFLVEEAAEGGFIAQGLGYSIFTQGDTLEELRANILDAVCCHFPHQQDRPLVVRLHHVRDEVLTL